MKKCNGRCNDRCNGRALLKESCQQTPPCDRSHDFQGDPSSNGSQHSEERWLPLPALTQPIPKATAIQKATVRRLYTTLATTLAIVSSSGTLSKAAVVMGNPIRQGSGISRLPDGNYRFCSSTTALADPFSSTESNFANSDPSTSAAKACFRFRKQANRVIGDYYYPADGASICFAGSSQSRLQSNRFTGSAVERRPTDAPALARYPQRDVVSWRPAGFLQVGNVSTRKLTTGTNPTMGWRFENAVLDLNGFYQYNAGRVLPPTDCIENPIATLTTGAELEDLVEVDTSTYYNQPVYLYESSVKKTAENRYAFTTLVGLSTPLNVSEYQVNCVAPEGGGRIETGGAQLVRSRYYDSDGDLQAVEGSNLFSANNRQAASAMPVEMIRPNAISRYICREYAQVVLPEAGSTSAPETAGAPGERAPEAQPTLETISIPAQISYQRYRNERFDYSVLYPADLMAPQGETGSQGESFRSETDDIALQVYAIDRQANETLRQRYQEAQADRNVTYRTLEDDDFFVVSGNKEGEVFYRKTFLESNVFKVLELRYDERLYRDFARIATVIGDSFAPVQTGSDLSQLPTEIQTAILRSASNNTEAESAIFEVVAVASRTWPDGCLGLARAGEACTQALVPGWRVRLEAEVAGGILTFIYRTDETGDTARFE